MEVPRLEIKSELQPLAYPTATALPDPRCLCNLHCSLWRCCILNPMNKARYQTHTLIDTMLAS